MPTEYDGRRIRVPKDLARRMDEVRGQVPFNRWAVGALEAALSNGESVHTGVTTEKTRVEARGSLAGESLSSASSAAASPRASDPKPLVSKREYRSFQRGGR